MGLLCHLLVVVVLLDATKSSVLQLQVLEINRGGLDPEPDNPVDDVGGVGVVHVVAEDQLQVVVDVAFAILGEAKSESLK